MKANGITKTKVIHAVLEGGIEYIPETEKESIYLPPRKSGYSGILMAMSDILQTKAGGTLNKLTKEPVKEPVLIKNDSNIISMPEKKENQPQQREESSKEKVRKKSAASPLSGSIG